MSNPKIKQPGCENVCFNKFSPISHVRFWGFEIIAVSLPSIIFIVFAAHEVARKFSKGLGSSNNQKFGTVKVRWLALFWRVVREIEPYINTSDVQHENMDNFYLYFN